MYEVRGKVAHITLDRPQELNVLTRPMLEALGAALEQAGREPGLRVIILAGSGRAFCAGHDLKDLAGTPQAQVDDLFGYCTQVMEKVRLHPLPVIARVHGVAAAAGCQLVASCDLAVAAASARFGTSGIKAGLFCSTPMVPLSRVVPAKKALEMLLTGDLISAEQAERAGLVNKVVPDGELEQAADDLAGRIAANSPYAVRLGKQAFYRQLPKSPADAYDIGRQAMVENIVNEEGQEGISAFLEKRPPRYRD